MILLIVKRKIYTIESANTILFALMMIFVISCKPTVRDIAITKLEKETLRGKVKLLSEKGYKYPENSKDSLILDYRVTYTFNEKGLEVRRLGLGQDIWIAYNSDNQEIKSSIYRVKGIEDMRNEFIYQNGNLVKHILRYIPSKDAFSSNDYIGTLYTYNSKNKLIEKKEFEKPKNVKQEIVSECTKYQYNDNGDCILEEDYNNAGVIANKTLKKYSNHQLVEIFTWEAFEGENQYYREIYKYNEDSTIVSNTKIVYKYNTTNEIVALYKKAYTYKYDKLHRLTESNEFGARRKTCKYGNFDIHGNWQQETIIEAGDLYVIVRKFEYYK